MDLIKAKISVIIPAYNAEKFIEDTLKSVFSQSLQPFEIIVIDDGSIDNTKKIVENYNVQYHYQKNQGTAAALNTGIKMATGEFLALLDHDDLWLPNKLELQSQFLMSNSDIAMVFSLVENVIVNNDLRQSLDVNFEPMAGIHKSALLVRRSLFEKVGYFSTESGTQEFLNWFAVAVDQGLKSQTLQEVLVKRTIHGTNQTILNKEMKNDFPKVLKTILDRRRKNLRPE